MSETTSQLQPLNYLKIFFRRKEVVIIPTIIGLILGICAGIILPKEYESSTVIMVEEGKSDNPLFDKLAVSTTVQQRLSTIRESMLGWNSLMKLVKRLNMDKDVKSPKELEGLIEGIRKDVKIQMRGTNIIDLAYTGKNPHLTQAVVKNITDIFISRNLEAQNQETSDAIIFIEEQLKVYRGKIKSAEIAGMKEQLKTLMVDSTEQHPRVQELRKQMAAKEDELRKENLQYFENINLGATNNPIIEQIKSALDNIEGTSKMVNPEQVADQQVYKVMLMDKLDKVMARDAGVNNKIYNTLLQRLETAKITQRLQSSKEGTKYTVLDPPRVPFEPSKPNKILVAFLGLLIGAVLGFGLVVSMEFLDKSFIDVEDAKHYLGQPLLGAISKITTEASLRRERENIFWLYGLTTFAGFVLIIVTKTLTIFLK